MLDKEIREKLFDYLDERYGRVRTIEEKIIKKSRADVLAVIDGAILGFEIKSDSDSYTRLKTQVKDYEIFCDKCYLVAGESHIHAMEHVPEYWGVLFVSDENVIVERDAAPCPKVKLKSQLDILWRNELSSIQEKEGLPKLQNKKRSEIYTRLIETAGEDKIRLDMTEELFERDYTVYDDLSFRTTKKGVRAKKKKSTAISASAKGDRKRAHVTNYVGKRKPGTRRKVSKKN